MLISTPAVWFFATTIEIHALSFLAVSLAGCIVLVLPWRRPRLSLGVAAVAIGFAYLAHPVTALAGLGWIWLIRALEERATGKHVSWKHSTFVVGPALGVTAYSLLAWLRWEGAGIPPSLGGHEWAMFSLKSDVSRAPQMLWNGVLEPLALLPLVAAIGALRSPGQVRSVCVAALAPPFVVLTFIYTVPEGGGFFLASAPFLAVLTAWCFERLTGRLRPVVLLVIAAQLALAYFQIAAYNSVFRIQDRIVQVRNVLGENGLLISDGGLAPRITHDLPGVSEISLRPQILAAMVDGTTPEEFARSWERPLRRRIDVDRVALDCGYVRAAGRHELLFSSITLPYYEALERMIEEHYAVERFDHPSWPLLLIREPGNESRHSPRDGPGGALK